MELDICSIGNAIVDVQFSIAKEFEEELINLKIPKGSMVLIEKDPQEAMIERLSSIYGEPIMACGGSAINSIIAASSFGSKCHVSGKVADDMHGNYFLDDLTINKVQHSISPTKSDLPTARCLVMVSKDAERTMCTSLGISNDLEKVNIDLDAIRSAKYLFIEGYLLSSPTAFESCKLAIEEIKKSGGKVAISLSAEFISDNFRTELDDLFNLGCDLLLCNESEALTYSQESYIEKAVSCLETKADQVLITLGPAGCVGFSDNDTFMIEGFSVEAIDTNGAGDAFAGAVLHCLCEGKDLKLAAKFGCFTASKKVQKFGPRLNVKEYEEIKTNFF